MKKLFLFVMIILPTTLLSQTVSGLKVETAAGSPSTVTFDVEWNKADLDLKTLWLDSMWVFVDYNKNGKMTRLLITGGTLTEHSPAKAGTGEFIPENPMGAWVYGDARTNSPFSATVQLYTDETTIAGACAYASSYPPLGQYVSESEIIFSGTPMYEVTLIPDGGGAAETVSSGSTFLLPCSYTVSSFTDATGAPGIFNCIRPATYTLSALPGTEVCDGTAVTLTLDGSESGWKYQLYNGSTPVSIVKDGGGALTFSAAAAVGGYSYTVRTVDGDGVRCDMPVSAVLHVTVNPLPENLSLITTFEASAICEGQSATLTASATGAASYSIDNNVWQTTTAFNVSPTSNKSYTLYVKSAAGCTATKTNALTVMVNPLPAAPTGASSNARCGSGTVTFSASVPGGNTIDWYTTSTGTALVSGGSSVTSFSPSIGSSTTYYAQARNSITGCISATRTPVTGTVNEVPVAPTSPSSNSRCDAGTVTFSADAAGNTIDWYDALTGGSTVTGGYGVTSFSPSIGSSTTYYAQARNSITGCISATRLPVTGTVNPLPTIVHVSGATSQSVSQGSAIVEIVYTATDATGISSSSSFPATVNGIYSNGFYKISGTPTEIGTFNYTVTTVNSNGCTNATASGSITVNIATPSCAASTRTWVFASRTWSDAINCSECNKSTFENSYTTPQCRSYTEDGKTWYYYNWIYVNQKATTLCPPPWRVPSQSDFSALVSYTSLSDLQSAWDPRGGVMYGGGTNDGIGASNIYFSSTTSSDNSNYAHFMSYTETVRNTATVGKIVGLQVRCVR
jgi:hypothetical protein